MGDYKQNAATRLWQRFTEMYGARFLESFGSKPTESWVDAMGDLSAQQVKGALAKIRSGGSPHPPSLPEFIAMGKGVQPEPVRSSAPTIEMSTIARYGNRALMAFLQSKGACTSASMAKLVAAKGRLCDAYEIICEDEPDACKELRDKLLEAFEPLWEAMTQEEMDAIRAPIARSRKKQFQPAQPEAEGPSISDIARGAWQSDSPFGDEWRAPL